MPDFNDVSFNFKDGSLDIEPLSYKISDRPNLFQDKWSEGSWMFLFTTKLNFVDLMMLKHRRIVHLCDGKLEYRKKAIEARESWYKMYEDMWENKWSLIRNWITIAAIIITAIGIWGCEKTDEDPILQNADNPVYSNN